MRPADEAKHAIAQHLERLEKRFSRVLSARSRLAKEEAELRALLNESRALAERRRIEVTEAWQKRRAVRALRDAVGNFRPAPAVRRGIRWIRAARLERADLLKVLDAEAADAAAVRPVSCVYFLLHGRECVYVGQSTNLAVRLEQHRRDGKRFNRVCTLPTPAERLLEREAHFIRLLEPPLNVAGPRERRLFAETES